MKPQHSLKNCLHHIKLGCRSIWLCQHSVSSFLLVHFFLSLSLSLSLSPYMPTHAKLIGRPFVLFCQTVFYQFPQTLTISLLYLYRSFYSFMFCFILHPHLYSIGSRLVRFRWSCQRKHCLCCCVAVNFSCNVSSPIHTCLLRLMYVDYDKELCHIVFHNSHRAPY